MLKDSEDPEASLHYPNNNKGFFSLLTSYGIYIYIHIYAVRACEYKRVIYHVYIYMYILKYINWMRCPTFLDFLYLSLCLWSYTYRVGND